MSFLRLNVNLSHKSGVVDLRYRWRRERGGVDPTPGDLFAVVALSLKDLVLTVQERLK